MKTCCHKSCNMSHIYHQYRTDFISYFTEFLEINGTCISARSGNDHFRLARKSLFAHSVIIQESIVIHTVRYDMEIFAGHVHR